MASAIPDDIYEALASAEHEQWAHWQRYLHSKCIANPDGSLTIPAELVARWEKQIHTPYEVLTEQEKASDREQVERIVPLISRLCRMISQAA